MKITAAQRRLLGLSREEAAILKALEEEAEQSVSAIARRCGLPRTSVGYILRKLGARGFAVAHRRGREARWRLASREGVRATLQSFNGNFGGLTDFVDTDTGVTHLTGMENVLAAHERVLELHRTERVYAIQGNKAAEADIEKINEQFIRRLHRTIKDKEIILEGIAGERILELFKHLTSEQLRSHADRLVVAHIVPDEYMEFDTDIFLFRDTAMFANAREESAIIIRNRATVNALHSIVRLMQDTGRKVDLNEYIHSLIGGGEK